MTEPKRPEWAVALPDGWTAGPAPYTATVHLHAVPDPDDGEDAELIAAAARSADEARLRRWHRVVPQRFHLATPADFTPEVADPLRAWGRNPDGRNLVIVGPTGTGKTRAACAAVRRAVWDALEVVFLSVPELLDQLRPGGPADAWEAYTECDRLVVDDLGAERPTDWTSERLYALVNRRWNDCRPLVATTNLDPSALADHLGERTFSRLVGGALVLRLAGQDRRRQP